MRTEPKSTRQQKIDFIYTWVKERSIDLRMLDSASSISATAKEIADSAFETGKFYAKSTVRADIQSGMRRILKKCVDRAKSIY